MYGITEDISSTIRFLTTSDLNIHLSDEMNKLLSNVVIGRHLMVFRLSITRVFFSRMEGICPPPELPLKSEGSWEADQVSD